MTSAGPLIVPAGLLEKLPFDPGWIVLGVLLIVLIVAGSIAVVRVRRWRQEDMAPPTVEDLLQSYQAMVERGDMDPQEFARIKAHLEQKSAPPPPAKAP